MEDLNKLFELSENYPKQLEEITEEFLLKLRVILWGQAAIIANKEKTKNLPPVSPQQSKKRMKRLSSLNEGNETEDKVIDKLGKPAPDAEKSSAEKSCKLSNSELLVASDAILDVDNTLEVQPPVAAPRTPRNHNANSNKDTENVAPDNFLRKSEATNLMPPPPAPVSVPVEDTLNKRPQRAAKIKSEKLLKEPTLKAKIRRPTTEDIKIKLEHEQRASQMHESTMRSNSAKLDQLTESDAEAVVKTSLVSQKSDDSVVLIPAKQPSIVSLVSDVEEVPDVDIDNQQTSKEQKKLSDSTDSVTREIRIRIKREKASLDKEENLIENIPEKDVFKAPMPLVRNEKSATSEEITLTNSLLSSSTNNTTKKTRNKKKIVHKPIKVERFSDVDKKLAPVSSRTRNGSTSKTVNDESSLSKVSKRPESIYEDAVETPPSGNLIGTNNATPSVDIVNETVNLGPTADATMSLGPVSGDATFSTNPAHATFQVAPGRSTFDLDSNPNATVTLNKQSSSDPLSDATFDVQHVSKADKNNDDTVGQRSFETAKDSSVPNNDSLLTEDEQEKPLLTRSKASTTFIKAKEATKTSSAVKAVYKVPTRTNELFNPLVQSPVKLRVKAFENAAAAAASTEQSKRPLRSKKENITPGAIRTPVIGKLTAPALGHFLTPTQTSNLAAVSSVLAKKATSASKAVPMTKAMSASSLQRSNSNTSTKTLQRENSADDFRKGLHNLAEERKKLREQKHLLAAQQREAKERERAERMAKVAKEREEKRLLKKQQEQEQKKRELDEIQRKLRQAQEDEAAKIKAAKERELLLQMKQQQLAKQKMMPPPPKTTSKYTFEMLHEDDSTDDEDKASYKRPPPPSWSRSHVRGPFMLKQEYTPAAYIDSFFSVQPMTPDLKIIFPNIDARHLKRNSSVFWSTPPRYSELPKY